MIVDSGTETKNGPLQCPSLNNEYKNVMVWMVFPRPISSAKIVSIPLAQEYRSQLRPLIRNMHTKLASVTSNYLPTDIREVAFRTRLSKEAACQVFSLNQ